MEPPFPPGRPAVPIVTPHPPDVLAVGAVLIQARSSSIPITELNFKGGYGFLVTKFG